MKNSAQSVVTLGFAATLCGMATPAHAQTDYEAIVRVMRDCARIQTVPERVACYDKTIDLDQSLSGPDTSLARPANQPDSRPDRADNATSGPQGFGKEAVPRSPGDRDGLEQAAADLTVASIVRRDPGIYVLTMDDGAQWQFVDTVSTSYTLPRPGKTVKIERAALGSFMMKYAGQRTLRIKRIR